jgi:hypothetical protein
VNFTEKSFSGMFAYVFKQNSEISDELYKIDDAMVSLGKRTILGNIGVEKE